jgi:hypothetical protein
MSRKTRFAALAILAAMAAAPAPAATLSAFDRVYSSGIFLLNEAQTTWFGVAAGTRIAFLGARPAVGGDPFAAGDVFDAQTVLNSCTASCASIVAVRNGNNPFVDYVGGYLAPLVTGTLNAERDDLPSVAAFLISGTSNVRFVGNVRFRPSRATTELDFVPPGLAPVPLPAALTLFGSALAVFAALGMRRRRQPA